MLATSSRSSFPFGSALQRACRQARLQETLEQDVDDKRRNHCDRHRREQRAVVVAIPLLDCQELLHPEQASTFRGSAQAAFIVVKC